MVIQCHITGIQQQSILMLSSLQVPGIFESSAFAR